MVGWLLLAAARRLEQPQRISAPLAVWPTDKRFDPGIARTFTKVVTVIEPAADGLGVQVLAEAQVPTAKVLRTASVLAQYLDNDEDGVPDDAAVAAALDAYGASVLMYSNADRDDGQAWLDSLPGSLAEAGGDGAIATAKVLVDDPDLGARPCAADASLVCDDTLELAWDLVATFGYAEAYPDVFGTSDIPDSTGNYSELYNEAQRLNGNCSWGRGARQARPPNCTGSFFDQDSQCGGSCQVGRALYLAVATCNGQLAVDGCWRGPGQLRPQLVNASWALCGKTQQASRALVEASAPGLYRLVASHRLPGKMPTGSYHAPGGAARRRQADMRGAGPRRIVGFSTKAPRARAPPAPLRVAVDARGHLDAQ